MKTDSTQQFIDIKEIRDGVVFLKNGSLRRILLVSGINFDLKSEEEQNILLYAFQDLLNAIDFPIQTVIHSRKLNIQAYLDLLERRRAEEKNELLQVQIEEYSRFIKSFVESNAVMNKLFFVVVPYDVLSVSAGGAGLLTSIFKKSGTQTGEQVLPEETLKNIEQLDQRVEEVITNIERVGLRVIPLGDDEIAELFYNLYNPAAIEKKGIQIQDN